MMSKQLYATVKDRVKANVNACAKAILKPPQQQQAPKTPVTAFAAYP
jgi:hypothetical protein